VSRRPRPPLALRALAREPSIATAPAVELHSTERLQEPGVVLRSVRLAPALPTHAEPLRGERTPTVLEDFRPAVHVVPATLRTAVHAVRGGALDLREVRVARATLPATTSKDVAPLPRPTTRSGLTGAILLVRPRPTSLEALGAARARELLTQLFRDSGAASPKDLQLIGVFEPAPLGAIDGLQVIDGNVALRLKPGARARPGTLVVGLLRSSGATVSASVDAAQAPRSRWRS
jgi:hypothetical protein